MSAAFALPVMSTFDPDHVLYINAAAAWRAPFLICRFATLLGLFAGIGDFEACRSRDGVSHYDMER